MAEAAVMTEPERHEIPIRRPEFPFGDDIPRHWAGGNPLQSHLFNALNLLFPDGERFFIRAVNDCLAQVEDPNLVRQARAFAGQEAMHGREHERYFELLRAQGYRIDRFLRVFRFFDRVASRFPARLRLSMTAGAEHYTATLGHFALNSTHPRQFHPTMEALVIWHATEEIEHKAVAFDVLKATRASYALRIAGFLISSAVIVTFSAIATRLLMRQDKLSRSEIRAARQQLKERIDMDLVRSTQVQLRAYFRRDFHPDDFDDLAHAHARLAEIDQVLIA